MQASHWGGQPGLCRAILSESRATRKLPLKTGMVLRTLGLLDEKSPSHQLSVFDAYGFRSLPIASQFAFGR
jgi:hypothetical protein